VQFETKTGERKINGKTGPRSRSIHMLNSRLTSFYSNKGVTKIKKDRDRHKGHRR